MLPLQISKNYAKILLALTETFGIPNYVAKVNTELLLNEAVLFPLSAAENVVGIVKLVEIIIPVKLKYLHSKFSVNIPFLLN